MNAAGLLFGGQQLKRLENSAHAVDSSLAMKSLIVSIFAAMLLVGCGPSVPDISMYDAAEVGNIEAVKQHLAAGTDVNAKDKDGWSPLHPASYEGHQEIVELLIGKGADVNARVELGPQQGMTPLDSANNSGRTVIASLLRKHGGKTKKELEAAGT